MLEKREVESVIWGDVGRMEDGSQEGFHPLKGHAGQRGEGGDCCLRVATARQVEMLCGGDAGLYIGEALMGDSGALTRRKRCSPSAH